MRRMRKACQAERVEVLACATRNCRCDLCRPFISLVVTGGKKVKVIVSFVSGASGNESLTVSGHGVEPLPLNVPLFHCKCLGMGRGGRFNQTLISPHFRHTPPRATSPPAQQLPSRGFYQRHHAPTSRTCHTDCKLIKTNEFV